MILNRCYKCCHEKICNYKERLINAVKKLCDTSYAVGNGNFELLQDSEIVVEVKCPHFMSEKVGDQNAQ